MDNQKYLALLPGQRTRSCEDEDTLYLDLPDGLRLVHKDGEYVGWYLPGEARGDD